jgi:hypothetical protein
LIAIVADHKYHIFPILELNNESRSGQGRAGLGLSATDERLEPPVFPPPRPNARKGKPVSVNVV